MFGSPRRAMTCITPLLVAALSLFSCLGAASELAIVKSTDAEPPVGQEARRYFLATQFLGLSNGALVLSGEGSVPGSRILSPSTRA